MTSRNALKIGIALSVMLVATALVLYLLARDSDPEEYSRSITEVQQIQQLAADWSVETARVKSDPLADYDALVAFIPQMDQRKRALIGTIQGIPSIPDRLANDVSAYASAIEAKEERIERFKTTNSVVRNSVRYLPLAAANIVQHNDADAVLAREVGNLANEINEYLAVPTDAAKGRLTAVVERLGEQGAGLSAPLSGAVANFVSHATVLLDRQAPATELFEQATSNDISDLSVRLINDLGAELGRLQQRSTLFMNGILAAAAALLVVWVAIALVPTRRAVQASSDAPLAVAALAAVEGATVAAAPMNAASTDGEAVEALQSEKLLMSQCILADTIGRRIAEASQGIAANAQSLPVENGAANEMRRQAEQIADMAERLSSVCKGREVSYALLNVNDCLDEVVEATRAEVIATVTMDTTNVPEVFASRTEICLMLEKIIENSVQAIEAKGFGGDDGKGEIKIATGVDDEKATVTVIDNGIGMAPEVRERMCEPFFTSKDGRAGIGLTTTSHLIEKYGGTFSVSSHEGGGTVTRIELPGMETT